MKYWDSSALVTLVLRQAGTEASHAYYREDKSIITWWGSIVECFAAVARLQRMRMIAASEANHARTRLQELAGDWQEVQPQARLRETAIRCVRVHDLRTGDALQLAAALTACNQDPSEMEFITFDAGLASAAEEEGFRVRAHETR